MPQILTARSVNMTNAEYLWYYRCKSWWCFTIKSCFKYVWKLHHILSQNRHGSSSIFLWEKRLAKQADPFGGLEEIKRKSWECKTAHTPAKVVVWPLMVARCHSRGKLNFEKENWMNFLCWNFYQQPDEDRIYRLPNLLFDHY